MPVHTKQGTRTLSCHRGYWRCCWEPRPLVFVKSVTDALDRTVSYVREPSGRVTTQTLPDSRQVHFAYDDNGNVTSVTPPSRPAHDFSYTESDRLASYDAPPLSTPTTTAYTYTLDRELDAITRPDGQVIDYVYDAAGRLERITAPDGDTLYTYDPVTGQLIATLSPDGVATDTTYDGPLLTSTSWSGPVSGLLSQTYNANFVVVGQQLNGSALSISYNADLQPTAIGALALTYNTSGRLAGTTLGGVSATFQYNTYGETTQRRYKSGGVDVFVESFVTDDGGRIVSATETVDGVAVPYDYAYDTTGRLTDVFVGGAPRWHYEYDGNSNRVAFDDFVTNESVSGTYDAQDRLLDRGRRDVHVHGKRRAADEDRRRPRHGLRLRCLRQPRRRDPARRPRH